MLIAIEEKDMLRGGLLSLTQSIASAETDMALGGVFGKHSSNSAFLMLTKANGGGVFFLTWYSMFSP